ncbi:putative toxin-antitoxin system toxin component, PIN family [Pseudomonas aeruginosa]|nr:putative toxin-antitoxin system toxin component, PIN family [Pseudomonas aeruginosa]KSN35506.2 putative toxin-antitoxin system toxin component, PIN family [Pseudomonas aeruginosa]
MNTIRWNVAVSADTDQSLRMFLASQGGGRKGDLSRFIEEAVRAHILELSAEQAKGAWRAARFEVVTSRMQLDEIRRASRYPKLQAILQPAKVGAMINNLQRAVVLERLTIEVEADDPDDSFLLAMALAGDADYLVTGDRRAGLLQRGHIERTRIVTPAVFCVEVL